MDYLDKLLEADMSIQHRLTESTNALLDWFNNKLTEIEDKISNAVLKFKKTLLKKQEEVGKSNGDILTVDLKITVGGKSRKIADKGNSKGF